MNLKVKPWQLSTFVNKYTKVLRWVTLLGGFCLLLMVIYTTLDVAGRYFANKPFPASFEITKTLLIFIVFLGLGYTQACGEHIRLGYILERSGPRAQAILDAICFLLGVILIALVTWMTWDYTFEAWRTNELMGGVWNIPFFPSRLALTVAMFLFVLQYSIDFIRRINKLLTMGKAGNKA